MRRLIVSEFLTLDGVMEAPGGEPTHPHTGWVSPSFTPEQEQHKFEEVLEAGSLLLGRVTYESFVGAWPTYEGPFADRMNSMPKHVVTSGSVDAGWNATAITGDVTAAIQELKAGDGGPILVNGSATLVQHLTAHDLVDEYRLMVFPVIVGGGGRLFPDDRHKVELRLVGSRTFSTGVVEHTYVTGS